MEENISERSGFVRLALGTGLTACGISHLTKESGNRGLGALFVAAGAMKVAEGIFLYCPTKALISSNVKEAVTTTFDEYLDGDTIMRAYNDFYVDKWGAGSSSDGSQSSGSSSNSSQSSGGSTLQSVAKTASQVAQTVSSATPTGTLANTASQTTKAVADTLSGNQNKQNQNNKQNLSSNNGQNAINPS